MVLYSPHPCAGWLACQPASLPTQEMSTFVLSLLATGLPSPFMLGVSSPVVVVVRRLVSVAFSFVGVALALPLPQGMSDVLLWGWLLWRLLTGRLTGHGNVDCRWQSCQASVEDGFIYQSGS